MRRNNQNKRKQSNRVVKNNKNAIKKDRRASINLKEDEELEVEIKIDKNGKTSDEKIFSGGDIAGTKGTVAWASRAGRNAAYAIIEYLK